MIWLAFTTGLLGSLHCAGMCGPIAMSLPDFGHSGILYYWQRIQYNLGRLFSYAALGAIAGLPGEWIKPAGWQQMLSMVAGALLIVSFLFTRLKGRISPFSVIHDKIGAALGKTLKSNKAAGWLLTGILNGLLPCGLVYIALAAALVSGGIAEGALFMLFFGLGTFPMMFIISISGRWLPLKIRTKVRHVLPFTSLLVGVLLFVRGMNLGIPYLSPEIKTDQGKQTMECCDVRNSPSGQSR